jgi:CheY-like chemotaxis protein
LFAWLGGDGGGNLLTQRIAVFRYTEGELAALASRGKRLRGDVNTLQFKANLDDPKRIFVVDDDLDHLATVGEVLREEGYLVETAPSGREALELMTEQRPDLILLDLLMPDMDGWALRAELRARAALSSVPVVVISQGGARMLARAPVASGYLSKPLHRRALLETIEACLARQRA